MLLPYPPDNDQSASVYLIDIPTNDSDSQA